MLVNIHHCCGPRVPFSVPPFATHISALLTKFSTEHSRWRRARHHCTSSDLVEETRDRTGSQREDVECLLKRRWLLEQPNTKISKVLLSNYTKASELERPDSLAQMQFQLQEMTPDSFESEKENGPVVYVLRDDFLHPLLGGNKYRKLDAVMPLLEDWKATDVMTCGGCQSAHTAALAFACAERGMKAHLLLRGEKPFTSTGYNLLSTVYGHTTYVTRFEYADREAMFRKYSNTVAGRSSRVMWLDELGDSPTVDPFSEKKVIVVNEGAGDAVALLGLIRLVHYLSQPTVFGSDHRLNIVVDTGTGTTAVGLALGIFLLRLPWNVTGVMLADTIEGYEAHKVRLISAFCKQYSFTVAEPSDLPLSWKERWKPRKFGNVVPGEVLTCRSVAQQTGILLDPIYTLAGLEAATELSIENYEGKGRHIVVMLHTGGNLGLFGLVQRYPTEFN